MATIEGLFHDPNQVEQARRDLVAAGCNPSSINSIIRDAGVAHGGLPDILLTVVADDMAAISKARLIMRQDGAEDVDQRDDDSNPSGGNEADRAYNATTGADADTHNGTQEAK